MLWPSDQVKGAAAFTLEQCRFNLRLIKDLTRIFTTTRTGPSNSGQLVVNHLDHFACNFVIVVTLIHLFRRFFPSPSRRVYIGLGV